MIYIIFDESTSYPGGVAQVATNIINNLSKKAKKQLTIIINDKKLAKITYYKNVLCVNLRAAKNSFLDKIFLISRLHYSLKIFFYLKKNVKENDIVNIHGLEYAFFPSLFRKNIKEKFKLIITCHGSYYEAYTTFLVKNYPNKFLFVKIFFYFWRIWYYVIEKIALINIDYIIFITENIQKYFVTKFKLVKPNSVIYNGVEITKKNKGKLIKHNRILTGIIVGSKYYLKGLDVALSAFKAINKNQIIAKLNVIGFDNKVKKNIQKNYSKFAKYIGVIKPKNINKYYRKSDFLILPSRKESFPLVVFENLLQGKPFIISEQAAKTKFKYNLYGFIVKGYNPNDWSKALIHLSKINTYNSFVKNINKIDFSNYDWKKIAKRYEQIFLH
jgi:hypothetical protein